MPCCDPGIPRGRLARKRSRQPVKKYIAGGQLPRIDVLVRLMRVSNITGAAHNRRNAAALLVETRFRTERYFPRRRF